MSIKADTIIRTIILAIALLNQILTVSGANPLPFSEDELYTILSTVATAVISVWAWWKNNSFTKAAIEADEVMKNLKSKENT
jgi:SPP1 family holin